MLKKILRPIALDFLYMLYNYRLKFSLYQNRIQFLLSHIVKPADYNNFVSLIDILATEHKIIGYTEAVERIWNGKIDDKYIVLSFDDGYKEWVRIAEYLKEKGIRACFFVCPGIIDKREKNKISGFDWSDVEKILECGQEIGGHTSNHENLALASNSQLEDEIGACYARLVARTGAQKHFAWPYGSFSHFSHEAKKYVFNAGYVSCASGVRGCHVKGLSGGISDLCIRRDDVEPRWPIKHALYFIMKSNFYGREACNHWPKVFA